MAACRQPVLMFASFWPYLGLSKFAIIPVFIKKSKFLIVFVAQFISGVLATEGANTMPGGWRRQGTLSL